MSETIVFFLGGGAGGGGGGGGGCWAPSQTPILPKSHRDRATNGLRATHTNLEYPSPQPELAGESVAALCLS